MPLMIMLIKCIGCLNRLEPEPYLKIFLNDSKKPLIKMYISI
jgi:hypothetical protein